VILLVYIALPVAAIIQHPAGEPNLTTWTDRPHQDTVGRWGTNSSCVAVSSNCIITTRHQGGGTTTPITIAEKEYEIDWIQNHSTADLRLVKLKNANLAHYVSLFTDSTEINQNLIMAGYGKGRGTILQTSGTTYGYAWAPSGNTTQRWGTNKVKGYDYNINTGYTSDVIYADFDGLGEGDSTTYETTIAEYDSGGGWFIKSAGQWKVAGLNLRVGIHFEEGHYGDPAYYLYEAWFRDRANPETLAPDYVDAVRISRYHQWITDTIPDVLPGDLNGDDWVDFADFAVFASFWQKNDCHAPDFCLRADTEPDGDVDFDDLAFLADRWLTQ
jgi:hypothetical protein